MKGALVKPQKAAGLHSKEHESPLLCNSRMAMLWNAAQGCRPEASGTSHLVADVLVGQVPHVVPFHVLIAQPTSHDQPPSTASTHTHIHAQTVLVLGL